MSLAMLAALAVGRQVGRNCVTLEARMCPAETVFQGVVVEERLEELAPPRGSRPGERGEWPDGFYREVLTIRVDETWKGSPGKSVTIAQEGPGAQRPFKDWVERRTPAVWFVEKPDRWSTLRLDAPAAKSFDRTSGYGFLPVLSMGLQVLRTPDDVRRTLRAWAPPARENPEVHLFPATKSLPSLVGIWADAYGLSLPLVPETVPTALTLIENPLSFLGRHKPDEPPPETETEAFEADRLREIGSDLLSRFKTPEGVARLRAMLGDRTVQKPKEGKPIYPVRKAAYAILRRWGVDVPAPILEEG